MDKPFDVYGIGNPLIDLLMEVDDNFLNKLEIDKGIMQLIDIDRRKLLLEHISNPVITPGGSCANTIITLADLGLKVAYGGGIGDDRYGIEFEKGLVGLGVKGILKIKSLPTGSSIIFISKSDAERSLNTYLGSCQEFDIKDVDEEVLRNSKYLYFTGYMWDTEPQKAALVHAMKLAKANNTKIIFDLADPFAVNRYKEDFIKIMKNDADLCFANMEEAKSITGKNDKEEVVQKMMSMCKSGAIKDGAQGSYVFGNGIVYKIEPFHVSAVDTTGAGDIYAAGMIYGIVKGFDLAKSGRIASYISAKVVELIGPRLQKSYREEIENLL